MGLAVRSCITLLSAIHLYFSIPPALGATPGPPSTDLLQSLSYVESEPGQRVVPGQHERRVNEFLNNYVRLSPEERVQLWLKSETSRNVKGLYAGARRDMADVLIAAGTDAVPYLAQVVRSDKLQARIDAVRILCNMDRFVPVADNPLHDKGASISVKPLGLRGDIDRFLPVDGRRIRKEGYETVQWAAEQTDSKELHFYARLFSGLLKSDLSQLTSEQQFQTWRSAIIKSRGIKSENDESYSVYSVLGKILIEKLPESLSTLVKVLETDKDAYLREETIELLAQADLCRMRLRGTEVGRRAIGEIQKALVQGNLKPVYTSEEFRNHYWSDLSAQFFQDQFRIDMTSTWALYARAFDEFYGEKATVMKGEEPYKLIEARPEMREFVTFLTDFDPTFPGWEYTYCGQPYEEVFHPLFKAKMDRYYEQWVRFQAGRGGSEPIR
jgi:hypothetical protein